MFIYVMDVESRDKLIELGYTLLKHTGYVWVFKNKDPLSFEDIGVQCVVSDTLTF